VEISIWMGAQGLKLCSQLSCDIPRDTNAASEGGGKMSRKTKRDNRERRKGRTITGLLRPPGCVQAVNFMR
jgi:hypothetical protein